MPIQFNCSQCQKKMQAPDGTEGKRARCPSCSAITQIPTVAVATAVPVPQDAPEPGSQALDASTSDNPFQTPETTDFYTPSQSHRSSSGKVSPSWERDASLGNFFSTIKEVLLSPSAAFRDLPRQGDLGRSLTFAALAGLASGVVGAVWQVVFMAFAMAGQGGGEPGVVVGVIFGGLIGSVIGAVFAALIAIVACFVGGGIIHLLLMLVGAKKYDYSTTVRATAYAVWSGWVFQIVPVVGPLIGAVWGMVVQIIGFAEVHEASRVRVAVAVLLPMAIMFFLAIAAFGAYFMFATAM